VWSGKPAAVASVSPGAIGGFGANHHLRQSLVFLDMPVLQQPEFYLGGAAELFDDSGALRADSKAGALFDKFINAFAAWVAQHATQRGG
jgi:chromate reductase, NAD(P)H dehydrogenase (quinone)